MCGSQLPTAFQCSALFVPLVAIPGKGPAAEFCKRLSHYPFQTLWKSVK